MACREVRKPSWCHCHVTYEAGSPILGFAGGHGAVFDLNSDPSVIALLEKQWAAGGVVAAVCHGPAGLIKPQAHNGDPIVKGKKVGHNTMRE